MDNAVYTLRHPSASDMFPMMRILRKIGVKEFKSCWNTEEIQNMISEAKENGQEVDTSEVGISVALNAADFLMQRLPECEKEIYAFLSGLSGMKEKEIAEMSMSSFANMMIDVFKDPEFSDFFTAVSRLFK